MKLQKQPSDKELNLAQILSDKVLFFNYFMPWPARDYQEDILLDPSDNVSVCAAREVGKSVTLRADVLQTTTTAKRRLSGEHREGLITTPRESHLKNIFNRLLITINGSDFLSRFMLSKTQSPYYIEFPNYLLHGRISGSNKAEGVLGLHVDDIWLDEGGLYDLDSAELLSGCLNKGGTFKVFGFPLGLRKTILFKADQIPSAGFSRHKITRFQDPDFTPQRQKTIASIYGGPGTQYWTCNSLAEWGSPQEEVFPERLWEDCVKDLPEYEILVYSGQQMNENDLTIDDIIVDLPANNYPELPTYLCADIGYNPDPTIIGIYKKINNKYIPQAKIKLLSISYTKQRILFDGLMKYFNGKALALDSTGSDGKGIALDLCNEELYPDRQYQVIPVNFAAKSKIGYDENENPVEELNKTYSNKRLYQIFEEKRTVLPKGDDEWLEELRGYTKDRRADGKFKYTGIDHHIAMLECLAILDLKCGEEEMEMEDEGEVEEGKPLSNFQLTDV